MSFDRLKEIEAQFASLTKERDEIVADIGPKELVKAMVQQFFDAVASIDTVAWKQYIPGFNDGDPCTFSVNGPVYDVPFKSDIYEELDDYDYDGAVELWESREVWNFTYASDQTEKERDDDHFSWFNKYTAEDVAALIEFDKTMQHWLSANQGMLIDTFGYAEIHVHRDGRISIGEYDCGW